MPEDYQSESTTTQSEYWVYAPKSELLDHLKRLRESFFDRLDASGYLNRVLAVWTAYHGLDHGLYPGAGVRTAGENGELRVAHINELRSAIGLLKTYVTSGKSEWDTLALSSDAPALQAAAKGNTIIDGYMASPEHGAEYCLSQAVEDSLVLASGFVWELWERHKGEKITESMEGVALHEGDISFLSPFFLDVAFDWHCRRFEDARWIDVRRRENKYDLAVQFPALADEILALTEDGTDDRSRRFSTDVLRSFSRNGREGDDDDFLQVHYFYHRPCPAVPEGKFCRYVQDVYLEGRDSLPDGHVPVHRLIAGEFLLTPFGYTPAFDALVPQELLDAAVSTVATNHDSLAPTKVWKKPGEPTNIAQLVPGISVIECETEPKALNLLSTPPEIFKAIEIYAASVRALIGTNASAHGAPPPSLRSSAAVAFTEQRVQQGTADLTSNYDRLLASVGGGILQILSLRPNQDEERNLYAPAESQRKTLVRFKPTDLEGVARVAVVRGNPLLRNLGGRIQVGEVLLQSGAVSPDEFLTLVKTGNLEKLMEGRDTQLQVIHRENETILQGGVHRAIQTDNHALHIRGHAALADSTEAREDPEYLARVLAAVMEHAAMMADPVSQQLSGFLGYGPLPPPPGMAPAGPGENKPSLPSVGGVNLGGGAGGAPLPPE